MKTTKNILINLLLISILSVMLLISCTVNDSTGKIRISNRTQVEVKNVKIGDKLLVFKVKPGKYYDYWYSSEIKGNLTAEGIYVRETQKDAVFTLKPGYWVYITASVNSSGNEEIYIDAKKQGTEELSYDEWVEED